jgi:hypothetical protein
LLFLNDQFTASAEQAAIHRDWRTPKRSIHDTNNKIPFEIVTRYDLTPVTAPSFFIFQQYRLCMKAKHVPRSGAISSSAHLMIPTEFG